MRVTIYHALRYIYTRCRHIGVEGAEMYVDSKDVLENGVEYVGLIYEGC